MSWAFLVLIPEFGECDDDDEDDEDEDDKAGEGDEVAEDVRLSAVVRLRFNHSMVQEMHFWRSTCTYKYEPMRTDNGDTAVLSRPRLSITHTMSSPIPSLQ